MQAPIARRLRSYVDDDVRAAHMQVMSATEVLASAHIPLVLVALGIRAGPPELPNLPTQVL